MTAHTNWLGAGGVSAPGGKYAEEVDLVTTETDRRFAWYSRSYVAAAARACEPLPPGSTSPWRQLSPPDWSHSLRRSRRAPTLDAEVVLNIG